MVSVWATKKPAIPMRSCTVIFAMVYFNAVSLSSEQAARFFLQHWAPLLLEVARARIEQAVKLSTLPEESDFCPPAPEDVMISRTSSIIPTCALRRPQFRAVIASLCLPVIVTFCSGLWSAVVFYGSPGRTSWFAELHDYLHTPCSPALHQWQLSPRFWIQNGDSSVRHSNRTLVFSAVARPSW